jgi:hypothetical protein
MKDDGEEYLIMYPKLRKWINECAMCHAKGYKPDMPVEIYPHPTLASKTIKSYFKPLELNEDGLCEVCCRILKKRDNK